MNWYSDTAKEMCVISFDEEMQVNIYICIQLQIASQKHWELA